jgi:NAD(P)-dependent dehydrogenase (short-subunit alcohol dehydrogenase family)
MKDFREKIAVITGAGTGMGRALACQLAASGCHLALCDILMDNLEETLRLASQQAPEGTRISIHQCDVSVEAEVEAFRDEVLREQQTDSINLLFNNAGVGGGGSFVKDPRAGWERTFNICWFGVYYNARAFMPLLVAAEEGYIVNTSSVNGFWASLGPHTAHSAYSASKFAVKGFTEALITDLRLHAPHVKAAVVMPGHIGTGIVANSARIHGAPKASEMSAEDLKGVRERMRLMGLEPEKLSDDQMREIVKQQASDFEANAPLSSEQAAAIILDGVRNERWRILVGQDAEALDVIVRENPERAYDPDFHLKIMKVFQDAKDQKKR